MGSEAPDSTTVEMAAGTLDDPLVKMPAIGYEGTNPLVIVVSDPLLFDFDSSKLAPRAQSSIEEILAKLSQIKYTRVEVRGHTDAQGPPDYNLTLSTERANEVRRELSSRGVKNLTAVGFGERAPRCPLQIVNGKPDQIAMACNRRVEILVYI